MASMQMANGSRGRLSVYWSHSASRIAASLLLAWCLSSCTSPPRINLVVISLDTTRADHLGVYGYAGARTPHIDALGKNGFVFRNHLTPVPITLPAHTSLFTGHYPPTHTVHDNGTFSVPAGEVTLAEVLRDHGYDTSAFVGAFPLAAQFQLNQGFDHYDDDLKGGLKDTPSLSRPWMSIYFDERPAETVVDAALAYHRQRDTRPFFTFLHFFDPHQPLIPPPPYDLQFRDRLYDGEIAYVDAQLGRFFSMLRERGEWQNTLIVLTADHGEGLGEHGELTHGILLHQATLHIPLIFHGPSILPGTTTEWTSATQVFATILDLLGIQLPATPIPVGTSLRPLLEQPGTPPGDWPPFRAYFETIAPRTSQGWSQLVGWMQGDWRLVHAPQPELYQLRDDPAELHNRFGSDPHRATDLLSALSEFLHTAETQRVGEAVSPLDPATRQRLAGLGYIQSNPQALTAFSDLLEVEGRLDPKERVSDISLFSEAKAALGRGNWNLAYSLHQELIRRSPDNAMAYRGLALLYGVAKDWSQCLDSVERAIQAQPDDSSLHIFHGAILIEMGRIQDGLDILLAQDKPDESLELCTWIGTAYKRLGQFERALAWYEKGLRLAPHNRWLHLYQANSLAAAGQADRAEPVYRALVGDAPYFHLAFYNYGKFLLDRGAYARAKGLLQRAKELAPQHAMTNAALQTLALYTSDKVQD